MPLSSDVIVGIDESNHGCFPEYYVAVISRVSSDLHESEKEFSKPRPRTNANAWLVARELGRRRTYTFLEARGFDYRRIAPVRFMGITTASLIYPDLSIDNFNNLHILFDGEWRIENQLFCRGYVADVLRVSERRINIIQGKNLDTRFRPVNMADRLAYALFRFGGSPQKMSSRKQRRELLE